MKLKYLKKIHIGVLHRCSERSKRSLLFLKRTRSFKFFSILFLANVSERTFSQSVPFSYKNVDQ